MGAIVPWICTTIVIVAFFALMAILAGWNPFSKKGGNGSASSS